MKQLKALIEGILLFGVLYLVYEIMYYGYMFLVRFGINQGYPWPDVQSYSSLSVDEISLYYVRDHPIEYTLICWLILFLMLSVVLALSHHRLKAVVPMRRLSLKNQLASILMAIGLVIGMNGLVRFIGLISDEKLTYLPSKMFGPYDFLTILIVVGAIIPIFEEIFFRGLLMGRLSAGFGPIVTVLLSSIIFSISHLNIAQGLFVLPIGLLSGILVVRTKSIVSGVMLHIIYNVLNIYLDRIQFFQYNSLQLLVMTVMGLALMAFGLSQISPLTSVDQ